jgi:hypothetical protein
MSRARACAVAVAHRDGQTMSRARSRGRRALALALACACACLASRVARARAFDDAWLDAVEDDVVDEPRGDFEFEGATHDAATTLEDEDHV